MLLLTSTGAYISTRKIIETKAIQNFHQKSGQVSVTDVRNISSMKILRHLNNVQLLFVPNVLYWRLHAPMHCPLHDLLINFEAEFLDGPNPSFPLSLKCLILHNVACGLAYLNERSPSIFHTHLSARNILLSSSMIADVSIVTCESTTFLEDFAMYLPPEAGGNILDAIWCNIYFYTMSKIPIRIICFKVL